MYILKPIELLNFDFYLKLISYFLYFSFVFNVYDYIDAEILYSNTYKYSNLLLYDNYSILEINLKNNSFFYLYTLFYLFLLFYLPIIYYQFYLLLIPSLYKFELKKLKYNILIFFISFFLYIKYLNFNLITFYFFSTFNNYYEHHFFEFDIEFDFLFYLKTYFIFLYLYYLNYILLSILFFSVGNKQLIKLIIILLNFIFFPFIVFIFSILFIYLYYYLILVFIFFRTNNFK